MTAATRRTLAVTVDSMLYVRRETGALHVVALAPQDCYSQRTDGESEAEGG